MVCLLSFLLLLLLVISPATSVDHLATCGEDPAVDMGSVDPARDRFVVVSHAGYDGRRSKYRRDSECQVDILVSRSVLPSTHRKGIKMSSV